MNKKSIFTIALIACLQFSFVSSSPFEDFLSGESVPAENQFDSLSKENVPFEPIEFEFDRQTQHTSTNQEKSPTPDDEILSASPSTSVSNESLLTKEAIGNRDLFGPTDEKKDVYLNFENADLKNFVEYIADIKSMNIIPDKSIAGNKISLNFRNPISKTGAWNTFLTVLEMSNLSIVKIGNLYRVISKDKKFRQPLPTFIGVKPEALPDSDATVRYIALLDNLPAAEVKDLLQSMLSQGATIMTPANINGFIITDCSCVIKAAIRVINELDQTGVEESVYVMQLKKANATDIKTLFDSLITSKDVNPLAKLLGKPQDSSEYFTPGTRLIPEERTNKLILMGQRQSVEKIKNFIVEHLDTELKQAKSPLRIYNLQNSDAADMVAILKSACDSSQSSSIGKQAGQYGAIRDGVKYFKNMTFQADKDGNRLLVSCADETDWLLLKETIKKLDVAKAQVAMQMLIVSISASSLMNLGGQLRSPNQNSIGGGVTAQSASINSPALTTDGSGNTQSILGNVLSTLALGTGSSVVALGNAASSNGIWGVFQALKTETDATVLSQPFAVAANCTETKLVVGSTSWVETQQTGGSGGLTGKTQQDANTTITFTPQVNSEGVIRLKIHTEIKDFVPDTGNLTVQAKSLNSTVMVANGQVLVTGGFIQTKISDKGGQTPLLGSIPILGWIAKNLNRTVNKSYLFLFLCPTILKPRTTPGIGMYTKMALHQAAKETEDAIKTVKTNDPLYNWVFNASGENYSHKVIDFANARYQPNNVDVRFDPYYRSQTADTVKEETFRIDNTESSPQEYIQKYKPKQAKESIKKDRLSAEKTKNVSTLEEEEEDEGENEAVVETPKPLIQKHTKKEKAAARTSTPQIIEEAAPERVVLETRQTTVPSDNEPASIAMFDVDQALSEKRSKLRSLLSHNSLGELLTKPAEAEKIQEMSPAEYEQAYGAPDTRESDAKETSAFVLGRRSGIKNLLSTGERNAQSNAQAAPSHTSSGLQSLFGSR